MYAGQGVEVPADSFRRERTTVERSVLRGFFDVVDYDDVDWGFG
jgi:hypothetical protein